jgi:hypothetical protein
MLGLFLEWLRNWQLLKKGSTPWVSEWISTLHLKLQQRVKRKTLNATIIYNTVKVLRMVNYFIYKSVFCFCSPVSQTGSCVHSAIYRNSNVKRTWISPYIVIKSNLIAYLIISFTSDTFALFVNYPGRLLNPPSHMFIVYLGLFPRGKTP